MSRQMPPFGGQSPSQTRQQGGGIRGFAALSGLNHSETILRACHCEHLIAGKLLKSLRDPRSADALRGVTTDAFNPDWLLGLRNQGIGSALGGHFSRLVSVHIESNPRLRRNLAAGLWNAGPSDPASAKTVHKCH